MNRREIFLCATSLVVSFVAVNLFLDSRVDTKPQVLPYYNLEINEKDYRLAIASTSQQHMRGLMFKEALADDEGMIFVFEKEEPRSFWMKNTKISLDIIFVNEKGSVVDIKERFEPCQELNCPTYSSIAPSKYVIEINGGDVAEIGLMIGDKLEVAGVKI